MASQARYRGTAKAPVANDAGKSAGKSKAEKRSYNVIELFRILCAFVLLGAALSWLITGNSFVFNWRQLPTLLGQAKRALVQPFFHILLLCVH